jgi:hypothetical protein
MKLQELADQINTVLKLSPHNADLTVCIPNRLTGAIGSPTVNVEYATQGFDWTNGKFLIEPEQDMITKEHALMETTNRERLYVSGKHQRKETTMLEMIDRVEENHKIMKRRKK